VRELRIALIGDRDPTVTAHQAIPLALALAATDAGVIVHPRWIHTTKLAPTGPGVSADGIWCVPASPYANTGGALSVIRMSRESGVPFLGTCAGFQHAILEAAESLWQVAQPGHAELEPGRADAVIAPLACSLVEVSGTVRFAAGSRLSLAYDRSEADEQYHCCYGLNPAYAGHLADGPLRATAWDAAGEVRAVELDAHPFFVATLFQPERAALAGRAPPLVVAFLRAVASATAVPSPS
jgi:CTP synthase (UTP-ammonia lyase)